MKTIGSHKQIASQCFNKVWDLLDLLERTCEQEEQMIHLAHTSFWHWTQVEDHTPTNLNRCVEVSLAVSLPPFYIGYAYEALARAYKVLSKNAESLESYQEAQSYAEKVVIEDSKRMLLKELEEIQNGLTV